ncbi:unnamed protein product, partial [Symbiodinium sp. CCMP2456]
MPEARRVAPAPDRQDRSPRTITMTRSRESAGTAKASPPPRGTLSALDATQARSREEDVRPMQVLPCLPVQELRSAIQPLAHHQLPPESRCSREAADVLSPHGSLSAQNMLVQGNTASSSRATGAVQAPKQAPHSRRASTEAVPGGSPGKATPASAEVQDLFPFYLDDKLLEMMKPSGPNCSDPMLSLKSRVCEELRVFALLPDADCHHCRGKDRLTNIPVFKSGTAPDVQVRVQLDTSSLWPKVTGIQCSCVDARNEGSMASCPKDASLPEAHLYWRQRVLTTSGDPLGRAKTLPPPFAESQWPEGIVEFLTSLISDAALSAVNHGLGDRAAELRAAAGGLLRGPDPDIARVMQDFPQLGTLDAYAKAQRSPLFFLQLAAPLWMAATIGEESLRQTLEDYRNQEATTQAEGVPLLRVALHTPVIYKSPQKGGKLFCGAILMFVLEHVQYLDSTKVAVALEHLLEFQAEPNSTYEMFPIGINCAIGHFSALCLTGKNPPMVEALLEKRADPHRRNLLNYFPSGSPLWTAVWRRQNFAIRKLLDAADTSEGGTDAEGVNRHGWHPDRAPLVVGQRAQGYNVLELASLTMGLEQVKLLVERKAMLGDELPHVLANCPAATARVLSQHVFCTAAHAASIVNGSALDQMNGMRLELVLREVLKHEEPRACLEKAIFKASEVEKVEQHKQRRWQLKNPQSYKEMMEALIK